jgi:hypothetical protein
VDLDYKALSNAGTWMIGRLQTDRDRARLLDGLEGAAGGAFDRAAADATIAALGKRRFYIHNVHAKATVEIESRWCLSYLRGPLTREDMKRLGGTQPDPTPPNLTQLSPSASSSRPLLPPEIPQFFMPSPAGASGVWVPHLYGAADVDFVDAKRGVDERRSVQVVLPLTTPAVVVDWAEATPSDVSPRALVTDAGGAGGFAAVPASLLTPKALAKWTADLDRWLARSQKLDLYRHAESGTTSRPGEDERAFRIRLTEVLRANRDAAIDKVRAKYASKLDTATEKVRRLELALGKEQQDVSQHRVQAGLSTASSVGAAVLGAIFGRRGGLTATTVGKASTAAKSWARGSKETEDVKRAEQNLAAARQALVDLEQDIERQVLERHADTTVDVLETVSITPKRGGVHVTLVALVWA